MPNPDPSPRQTLRLEAGWKFHRGDVPVVIANKHISAYMANKAGWAGGAAKPNFDDSDWRALDLPHDWSIEGPFDPANHVNSGFLPRGVGWYRRRFRLEPEDRGKSISIRFDGISSHCAVYVNGHALARSFCGYTPVDLDLTDVAHYGDELNVVAVRVDATPMEGWWYEGAGIYRHVWLTVTDALHVEPDGLFVEPRKRPDGSWETRVHATLRNDAYVARACVVACEIADADGRVVASSEVSVAVDARRTADVSQSIPTPSPRLWSIGTPALCRARVRLLAGGAVVDEASARFGYRTIAFDADQGFFLNGEPVKLKGTCNHQDHAGVGVAVPDAIHAFRVNRLREMGTNAYRCAHNPPAPELLDACDEAGMLVIDENRNFGSSPEHLRQLEAMVRRDRNHPCVILWSLCNEEGVQGTPVGASLARAMQARVKQLDPSRPVTAAVSGGILNDDAVADVVEVMGINYQLPVLDAYHAKHPNTPLVAAENDCALSTRGTYATDAAAHRFASYDQEKAFWGNTIRETWRAVRERPFVAGAFAWTGFDYRGEPSPSEWPCVSSHWGVLDTCGFAKDAFHLHRAHYAAEPFVHLLPHWNWPGREGETIRVAVYTNAPSAELYLNDESLGRKAVDPVDMAEWPVAYRPGALRAVAFERDGRPVAETTVETTGEAVALGLEVHASASDYDRVVSGRIPADGEFAWPVTAFAVDAGGRRVPTAEPRVTFSLDGPAMVLGVGNGDPLCHEPDKASARSLFRGLAQVILRATADAGPIVLTATSPGLLPARLALRSVVTAPRPSVPPARVRHWLGDWRMSAVTPGAPDPHAEISASDMNSWERVNPGAGPQRAWERGGGYAVYRATFTPPKSMRRAGGRVAFHAIDGAAEVFLDGAPAGATRGGTRTLEVPFAPTARTMTLSVRLRAERAPAGLSGAVELLPPAQIGDADRPPTESSGPPASAGG